MKIYIRKLLKNINDRWNTNREECANGAKHGFLRNSSLRSDRLSLIAENGK